MIISILRGLFSIEKSQVVVVSISTDRKKCVYGGTHLSTGGFQQTQ